MINAYDEVMIAQLVAYFKTLPGSTADNTFKRFACAQHRYLVKRYASHVRYMGMEVFDTESLKDALSSYVSHLTRLNTALSSPVSPNVLLDKMSVSECVSYDQAILIQQLRENHAFADKCFVPDTEKVKALVATENLPRYSIVENQVSSSKVKLWAASLFGPVAFSSWIGSEMSSADVLFALYVPVQLLCLGGAWLYSANSMSPAKMHEHLVSTISTTWDEVFKLSTLGDIHLLASLRDLFDRWPEDRVPVDFCALTPDLAYALLSHTFDTSAPDDYLPSGYLTKDSIRSFISALSLPLKPPTSGSKPRQP